MRAEQLTDACAGHGEGPVWDAVAGVLRWVDMMRGDVLTLTPAGSVSRLHVSGIAAALRPRSHGGLAVAVERGFTLVDADGTAGPELSAFTDPQCRMNDGGADRQGRFLCGSMAYDMTSPRGALYRLDPDGTVTAVLREVTVSNGIAWDAAGEQMFYIDSATQRVDVFDYDTAAGLAAGTPGRDQPRGRDARRPGPGRRGRHLGCVVAGQRCSPVRAGGRLDAVIELPAGLVTACAFGGDDLSDLFITTSRMDLEPGEQPAAGAVFTVRPGVRGLATGTFAG